MTIEERIEKLPAGYQDHVRRLLARGPDFLEAVDADLLICELLAVGECPGGCGATLREFADKRESGAVITGTRCVACKYETKLTKE